MWKRRREKPSPSVLPSSLSLVFLSLSQKKRLGVPAPSSSSSMGLLGLGGRECGYESPTCPRDSGISDQPNRISFFLVNSEI